MGLEKFTATLASKATPVAASAGLRLDIVGVAGVRVVKLQTWSAPKGTPGMVMSSTDALSVAV